MNEEPNWFSSPIHQFLVPYSCNCPSTFFVWIRNQVDFKPNPSVPSSLFKSLPIYFLRVNKEPSYWEATLNTVLLVSELTEHLVTNLWYYKTKIGLTPQNLAPYTLQEKNTERFDAPMGLMKCNIRPQHFHYYILFLTQVTKYIFYTICRLISTFGMQWIDLIKLQRSSLTFSFPSDSISNTPG